MSLVIRAAARTVPVAIRDRYREQWLADSRDAAEAGLRPASIALAALAFAVTVGRPAPAVPANPRLAVGLALGAALLSLAQYPRVSFQGLTDIAVWDFTRFFVGMLLVAYGVLAPITALVLVRGARRRLAVVLLVLATVAPFAALSLDSAPDMYVSGLTGFVICAVLVIAACAVLWRPSGARSLLVPAVSAVGVWLVAALGLVYGNSVAWSEEVPLAVIEENPDLWAEWQVMREAHEAIVAATFGWWAVLAAALGILVFLAGRLMSARRAAALGVAAVALSLLGASGVLGLLELGIADSVLPVLLDPLRLLAQVLLVATALVAVGGVRYLPRVRHRRDVEGAVELL